MYTYIHKYAYMYTYIYIYVSLLMYLYRYLYIYIYVYMDTYLYTYVEIQTDRHRCRSRSRYRYADIGIERHTQAGIDILHTHMYKFGGQHLFLGQEVVEETAWVLGPLASLGSTRALLRLKAAVRLHRAPKSHVNIRIRQTMISVSPLCWALESECELLMFM